jgi:CHAD domain-containing protein
MPKRPEQHTEVERKYDVPADAALPDLVAAGLFPGSTRAVELLDATYYDTDDRSLFAHRVVLRRRSGGHDAGWHVKSPSGRGRNEFRWPLGRGRAVPAAVRAELKPLIDDHELKPLARVRTTRTVVTVQDAAGTPQVEICDDLVETDDLRRGTSASWREWEAEVSEGIPAEEATRLLDRIESALLAHGAQPSVSASKLARAIGETPVPAAPPAAPDAAAISDPDPAALSAAAALGPAVQEIATRLLRSEEGVRRDAEDAVHQARVQVRTLRSLLHVYRPLFRDRDVERLDTRLKRFGRRLGEARDAEVRARFLRTRLDELGELGQVPSEALQTRLDAGSGWKVYQQHHRRLVKQLDSRSTARLRSALEELITAPPFAAAAVQRADLVLPPCLRAALGELERATTELEAHAGSEEHLHAVRKAARRLRYGATALKGCGLLPADALKALISASKQLQDALGDHRDDVLLAERVEGFLADTADPADAAVLTRLRDHARERAAAELLDFEPQLRAVFSAARSLLARWAG